MSLDLLAAFPGVGLLAGFDGRVRSATAGPDAPLSIDGAVGRPLHAILGLHDDAPESGALQLWLACVDGATSELWALARNDPPATLPLERGTVALEYGPVLTDGLVTAVAVFVRRARDRPRATSSFGAVHVTTDPRALVSFVQSASDLLLQCDAAAARIASDREARAALHRLFRAVHTIKGEAHAPELCDVRETAHATESVLASVRGLDRAVLPEELDAITAGLARVRAAVRDIAVTASAGRDAMTVFYARVRPQLTRMQRCLERGLARPRVRRYFVELHRVVLELVEVAERAGLGGFADAARHLDDLLRAVCALRRVPQSAMARVEQGLDRLDLALGLYQQLHLEVSASEAGATALALLASAQPVGDDELARLADSLRQHGVLAIARRLERDGGSLASVVQPAIRDAAAMFAPVPGDFDAPTTRGATRLLAEAAVAAAELETTADPREVSQRVVVAIAAASAAIDRVLLDDLAGPLASAARTVAAALGKQVRVDFDLVGLTTSSASRRALSEIAIHAIRNAIDHGIEAPEQRIACGKPIVGRIGIRIDGDDRSVSIEVIDDGRGVDLGRVCALAIERELLSPAEAARATDAQLLDLLFEPAFSTASNVSMISGRGVGMDVIRSTARELGGSVSIATSGGVGTRLRIVLPCELEQVPEPGDSRRRHAAPGIVASTTLTIASAVPQR